MKFVLSACTLALILLTPSQLAGENVRFSVQHDHLLGSGRGYLTIHDGGISYLSERDEKHVRNWEYAEIQEIKIDSPHAIAILTYEDVRWRLNSDRLFEFEILNGAIRPEIVEFLGKLPTVLVTAVFREPREILYRVPAKHQHSLGGGCEGELLFSEEAFYYKSASQPEHSRFWPLQGIESLGRQSDFNLRITAIEQSSRGNRRNYQFQLKRPLDRDMYESLWRKIYEPKSWLRGVSDQ